MQPAGSFRSKTVDLRLHAGDSFSGIVLSETIDDLHTFLDIIADPERATLQKLIAMARGLNDGTICSIGFNSAAVRGVEITGLESTSKPAPQEIDAATLQALATKDGRVDPKDFKLLEKHLPGIFAPENAPVGKPVQNIPSYVS